MAAQFIYELTDTWNSIGTSYNGIKLNVTDAASAADSKLINLQIGGTAKFTVDKNGNLVTIGSLKGSGLILTDALSIASGGTGGKTAAEARSALGLAHVDDTADLDKPPSTAQIAAFLAKAGGRLTGALSSAVKAHGSKSGTVTEALVYGEANTHSITIAGAVTLDPQGLAEGDVMQVNVLYQSGTLTIAGTTQWELGGGSKSTTLGDLGITLTAGTAYRIVLEVVAGVRTGVFQ